MSSCVVADAPDEKPSGGAGITISSFASSVLTPCGPVRSVIGPVGPCSPGIHLGETRLTAPAATGISNCACRIFSGACVASTISLMGCAGALLAVGCGLRFWAGLAIVVMIKANSAMCRKNFGMVEFFSLWSEARLKGSRAERKRKTKPQGAQRHQKSVLGKDATSRAGKTYKLAISEFEIGLGGARPFWRQWQAVDAPAP